jgi:2-iminobutanoate/2-iminopropanoate deaminase
MTMPRRALWTFLLSALLVWAPAPAKSMQQPAFRPAVTAAGYVYVSTLRAAPDVPEDVAAQTQSVFAQLRTILEANQSSMGQLCSVTVSLKRVADFAAMNAAYAAAFSSVSSGLPARTTLVGWLPGKTLIEVSAIAVPNGATREALHPAGWAKSPRPYSYIIKTDDLVFFSGLISRRGADDAVVAGSVKVQAETILDNVGTLLETADLAYEDIAVCSRRRIGPERHLPSLKAPARLCGGRADECGCERGDHIHRITSAERGSAVRPPTVYR